ncbi:hypothetical protein A6A40_19935 (plasmid) [Azospirillum humicireducens]|uniref:Uncharacterized protein n=2 Tax=Azospirillum humicireducens TaxID=1226968 RepID=A0A2R4VS97_9PROT|nr:hypothetical protein A6A40_19935 [Azospirillum humicireducens]
MYRQRIAALHERLQSEETKAEAASILRGLVDRITLQPARARGWQIVLRGDLTAMLSFAANTKKPGLRGETGLICDRGSQASLVAGARSHRELTLPPAPI